MHDDHTEDERQRLIEERLFELATAEPINKRGHELRKLITQWRFILSQRQQGRPVACIVRLLAKMNIHVFEGTARNYIPRIERAIKALECCGNTFPQNDEIYTMVVRLAKRKSNPPSHQSPPPTPKTQERDNNGACRTGYETERQKNSNDAINDEKPLGSWERLLTELHTKPAHKAASWEIT